MADLIASPAAQVILVMGVAGSGKTTIGRRLADALGWGFADADDFHPPANLAKMTAGRPLDDADRAPWLAALCAHLDGELAAGRSAVITCSALKQRYRDVLVADPRRVRLVHLQGSRALLWTRIGARTGHFMKPEMLDSQLAALEPPADALTLDIAATPETLVATIRQTFGL